MNRLLSIDPGLDGIGVAVFDAEKYSPSPDLPGPVAAVRAWEASWTITNGSCRRASRTGAAAIALQLQADLQRWAPRLVYPRGARDLRRLRGQPAAFR